MWFLAVHLNKFFKAGTIFSSYVYTRSTTASSWSSHTTTVRASELAEFRLLQFLSLTFRSPLLTNRSLCPCSTGWPFLPETQTRGIISSAAYKINLFILSVFAHLPAHLRSNSPTTLCTLHHTTIFYFHPMFPTSPQEFATYLGPFLVPTSASYSAQNALPAWQVLAATTAAPALHGCCLAIWHSRLPAQVTAFRQLVDQAEQTTSLLSPSFLGWGH